MPTANETNIIDIVFDYHFDESGWKGAVCSPRKIHITMCECIH
jgi:hypothetical protein